MTAWSTFKTYVGNAYNEGPQSTNREQAAIQAVSDFVKAKIIREVDGDLQWAKSYLNSYLEEKVRLAGYTMTSNFATTKTGVQSRITVDASRAAIATVIDLWIQQGMDDLNGTKTIYDAALLEAVIDLQRYIDNYRNRHTDTYIKTQFTAEGNASALTLTSGARPYRFLYYIYYPPLAELVAYVANQYVQSNNKVYKVVTGGTIGAGQMGSGLTSITPNATETLAGLVFQYQEKPRRYHRLMKSYDWAKREDLSENQTTPDDVAISAYTPDDFIALRATDYLVAVEPRGRSILVWPRVLDYWGVQVEWDGIKSSFGDSDDEQFDVAEARAVSYYIRSIIEAKVGMIAESNRDLQLYAAERRKLWIQQEDKKTQVLVTS